MDRSGSMDQSVLAGLVEVRNFFGEGHDLWLVNTEQSCQEEANSNGGSNKSGARRCARRRNFAGGQVDSASGFGDCAFS
jgi:hypothetical protein